MDEKNPALGGVSWGATVAASAQEADSFRMSASVYHLAIGASLADSLT
jgi:hypothetical protein